MVLLDGFQTIPFVVVVLDLFDDAVVVELQYFGPVFEGRALVLLPQ